MSNDLISRKYVKAEVAKRYDLLLQNNGGSFRELCDIYWNVIDNAPAVENITVFCENADEKTIADLKEELQKIIAEKRQKADMRGEDNG